MRTATITRKTKETNITVTLNLDGTSVTNINTGIEFFDHMLTALCVHSGFDISINVQGDLKVDCHHTIEDVGICLGMALRQALGDISTKRYASFYIPMDEALCFSAIDICGRAFLVFNCNFTYQLMGQMETAMVEEFFRAFAFNSAITLHINVPYGKNDHHKAEAIFKSVAHCLKTACVPIANSQNILSTKGVL